ncbi:MAG TPA: hypothetical protein IAA98_12675 [Candidatus Avipropionibacterium avicola]|uniref:NAD-dependent epimerase/dehydratase domain-containing protein n=1 Tax=Candidatus Avipropionibacterium avicola TaxID=2840701 RepID=A0A9D1H090_9ACTN|nr:hypothetical protein [Candidatus Avipropionibacterium avicola]
MRVLLVDVPDVVADPLTTQLAGRAEVTTLSADLLDPSAPLATEHDVVVHGLGSGSDEDDQLLRSTLGTWNLLHSLPRGRYVQLSTMQVFDGYDDGWDVRENWQPRPTTDPYVLACHLGELTGRDLTRGRDLTTVTVRLDEVVSKERFAAGPVGPRWLHLDDAVSAVLRAIHADLGDQAHGRWAMLHAVRGDGRFSPGSAEKDFGFRAEHTSPTHDGPNRPSLPTLAPVTGLQRPERITLYGAGGPLGAATLPLVTERALVRATDVTDLAELARRPPQSEGAPVPSPLSAPHENLVVDVSDAEQVRAAAVDADCLVNLSVVRVDTRVAFAVNLLGAWHTVRAAVSEGVPRVVQTGPTLAIAPYPWGSTHDRRVDGTQDFRSGDWIYLLTKMLGQEVCRIVAEAHGLACPVLLYCGFSVDPATRRARSGTGQPHSFSVSWADAGRSVVAAMDVERLDEPSPVVNILAPQPHDAWTVDRARRILGWQAEERLDELWFHPRVRQG